MSSLIVEVCRIDSVEKHPNADRLSIAKVKGWNCIIQLDQYKVGDLVVFIPPDCVLPDSLVEEYNLTYLRGNNRTRTVKLRGYLSEGLILPITNKAWWIGDNVADKLCIKKYEEPQRFNARFAPQLIVSKKKLNPFFDKYTDVENIKNFPDVFQIGDEVVITEKIHGSNARFARLPIYCSSEMPLMERIKCFISKNVLGKKYEFVYGSHNIQLYSATKTKTFYGTNIWEKIARREGLEETLTDDMIVYAEIYGNGVQDLTYGLIDNIDYAVFDIKYDGKYLDWMYLEDLCHMIDLPLVPVLYIGKLEEDTIAKYTVGQSVLYPSQIREGCVIKSYYETNHPRIGRKILKSVNPEYLTRKNGTEHH